MVSFPGDEHHHPTTTREGAPIVLTHEQLHEIRARLAAVTRRREAKFRG